MKETGGRPQINRASDDDLHQLIELLRLDEDFALSLRKTTTTAEASDLVRPRGIHVSQEALWRHRGTLTKSGKPTWRG